MGRRIRKRQKIFDSRNWRNVVTQAGYQVLVTMILMYFGAFIFFEKPFDLIKTPSIDPDTHLPTDRMTLNTIIFQTFFMMNLFNQISCKLRGQKLIHLFVNKTFWLVFVFEVAVQICIITAGSSNLGQAVFQTTTLCLYEHTICVSIGLLSIPLDLLNEYLPDEWFLFIGEYDFDPIVSDD